MTLNTVDRLPLLVVGYSRQAGIDNLLKSIDPKEVASIFLAVDGSNSENIRTSQKSIVELVTRYCDKNSIPLRVWRREDNLGVAVSIITALDWFFSEVPFGVILEDDLTLGADFFEFMRRGLVLLESDANLLMVSGDYFLGSKDSLRPAFVTNYPLIWGWATNSKNWSEIRRGILSSRRSRSLIRFNRRKNYWRVGALRALRGQVDTWDLPFADYMISENKFCLFPSANLVSNKGADSFAAHTMKEEFPLNLPTSNWHMNSDIELRTLLLDSNAVNLELDEKVYKIGFRHSFLGVFFLLRLILGFERRYLEDLRIRVDKTEIPSLN